MTLRNLELSKSIALALASSLLLPSALGCAAPAENKEERRVSTSRITQCGDDEEQRDDPTTGMTDADEVDSSDDVDSSGEVAPQRLRILANVCTPQNPTGEEERCANGGVPPRCEVLTQGPSPDQTRAAACAQARLDERFARPGPVLNPAQNARVADAMRRIQAFCDD